MKRFALALCISILAGCGARNAPPAASDEILPVRVENTSFKPMNVYLRVNGSLVRLGHVEAATTAVMRVPLPVVEGHPVAVVLAPMAEGTVTLNPAVQMQRGMFLRVLVTELLSNSVVYARE